MKKKFLSLLLSCVTAISLLSFAGCGENYVLGERNPVDENEIVYTAEGGEKTFAALSSRTAGYRAARFENVAFQSNYLKAETVFIRYVFGVFERIDYQGVA